MSEFITATTDTVPGYQIDSILGIVTAATEESIGDTEDDLDTTVAWAKSALLGELEKKATILKGRGVIDIQMDFEFVKTKPGVKLFAVAVGTVVRLKPVKHKKEKRKRRSLSPQVDDNSSWDAEQLPDPRGAWPELVLDSIKGLAEWLGRKEFSRTELLAHVVADVQKKLGSSSKNAEASFGNAISKLIKEGKIKRLERGKYQLID